MLCPCSAERASMGKPRAWNSASMVSSCSMPSTLLTTSRVGFPARRTNEARCSSNGIRPSRPSTTRQNTEASSMAACVCWRISASNPRSPSGPSATEWWLSSVTPPVSIRVKERPLRERTTPSIRSRVTPGRSWVMARLLRISRLNSVDLPTLGRPSKAILGSMRLPHQKISGDARNGGQEQLRGRNRPQTQKSWEGWGYGGGEAFFQKALLPRSVQGNYFVGSMTS